MFGPSLAEIMHTQQMQAAAAAQEEEELMTAFLLLLTGATAVPRVEASVPGPGLGVGEGWS